MEPAQLIASIERRGLRRYSGATITSLEDLREQCALIRGQGHAIDNGEYNELVRCVAAPVFDGRGQVVAAVSITAVGADVQSSRFRELVDLVAAAAREISAALGYISRAAQHEPQTPARRRLAGTR